MNQSNQTKPKNLVGNIVDKVIYLENTSNQMADIVKKMGAVQKVIETDLFWVIECDDKDVLIKTLLELNRLGFLFVGGHVGYSAADIFALLLEKKGLNKEYKEVRWRGPGDWFIIER